MCRKVCVPNLATTDAAAARIPCVGAVNKGCKAPNDMIGARSGAPLSVDAARHIASAASSMEVRSPNNEIWYKRQIW